MSTISQLDCPLSLSTMTFSGIDRHVGWLIWWRLAEVIIVILCIDLFAAVDCCERWNEKMLVTGNQKSFIAELSLLKRGVSLRQIRRLQEKDSKYGQALRVDKILGS